MSDDVVELPNSIDESMRGAWGISTREKQYETGCCAEGWYAEVRPKLCV